RRRARDRGGARDAFAAAAAKLPAGEREAAVASLSRAEVAHELGNDDEAQAVVDDLRDTKPRGLTMRRVQRLAERIRLSAGEEESPEDRLDEGDLRLAEG